MPLYRYATQPVDAQRPRYLEPRVVDDGNRQVLAYEEEDDVVQINLPHRRSPVQLVRHEPIHTLVDETPNAKYTQIA